MKKTILALAALLGTGAMGWAQSTTTNGTSGSTTTNSTSSNSTMSPGSNTSTNTNTNTSTGTDLNGTGTFTGVNGNAPTTDNMTGSSTTSPVGSTSSMVNPGNSAVTGTLQSSTSIGTDYNTSATLQSNSNYAAYGSATAVPGNLSMSLQRDYPSAFNPSWQQSGDWYRASFNNMNRNMMVYYAPNGNSYSVALPVLNGYVPEEVVTKALSAYGTNLYSISRVKAANGEDAYQVNLLDGGTARNEFIAEDGSSFAAIDVFRHEDAITDDGTLINSSSNAAIAEPSTSTDANAASMDANTTTTMDAMSTDATVTPSADASSSSSEDVKFKQKIKTEDGRKLKIKTKNGETKVKGDAMDADGGQ